MSARVYGAWRCVMHSGQRRATSTSWSPCGSQRSGWRKLDPQLGHVDSAMLRESRPVAGRKTAGAPASSPSRGSDPQLASVFHRPVAEPDKRLGQRLAELAEPVLDVL